MNAGLWSFYAYGHYAFPQTFSVGGASWTSDSSKEAVNWKKKLTNNKFAV